MSTTRLDGPLPGALLGCEGSWPLGLQVCWVPGLGLLVGIGQFVGLGLLVGMGLLAGMGLLVGIGWLVVIGMFAGMCLLVGGYVSGMCLVVGMELAARAWGNGGLVR